MNFELSTAQKHRTQNTITFVGKNGCKVNFICILDDPDFSQFNVNFDAISSDCESDDEKINQGV